MMVSCACAFSTHYLRNQFGPISVHNKEMALPHLVRTRRRYNTLLCFCYSSTTVRPEQFACHLEASAPWVGHLTPHCFHLMKDWLVFVSCLTSSRDLRGLPREVHDDVKWRVQEFCCYNRIGEGHCVSYSLFVCAGSYILFPEMPPCSVLTSHCKE